MYDGGAGKGHERARRAAGAGAGAVRAAGAAGHRGDLTALLCAPLLRLALPSADAACRPPACACAVLPSRHPHAGAGTDCAAGQGVSGTAGIGARRTVCCAGHLRAGWRSARRPRCDS